MIHSPPLNIFSLFMLPTLAVPNLTEKVTKRFSILNFWIENIFIIIVFMAYELVMVPFAYLLTFYNLLVTSSSKLKTVINWIKWLLFGILYLIFFILQDIYFLLKIMSMYNGCIAEDSLKTQQNDDEDELTEEQ